jgi:hypothetical protein
LGGTGADFCPMDRYHWFVIDDRYYRSKRKNLTNGMILSVVSMTNGIDRYYRSLVSIDSIGIDSIGIDPSIHRRLFLAMVINTARRNDAQLQKASRRRDWMRSDGLEGNV